MWDEIKSEIFENNDMDIYEKMCLIVLIGLGDDVSISSELLARYMGCTVLTAKKAFEALQHKGYLASEDDAETHENRTILTHPNTRESRVLTTDEAKGAEAISKPLLEPVEQFREGFFIDENYEETLQSNKERDAIHEIEDEKTRREKLKAYLLGDLGMSTEFPGEDESSSTKHTCNAEKEVNKRSDKPFVSVKSTKERLVDEVINIIEEKISFKEANIILGFAGNDIEKIKRKYHIAKMSQVSDAVGVLINELQKKEPHIIKSEEMNKSETVAEESAHENSQVNTYQIKKMQAYHRLRKGNHE